MNNMLGEALREVSGPLEDLHRKLGGAEGVEWLSALKRFLRKEESWRTTFRETGELMIHIPALPRPTLTELQAKFSWIKSIERDTSPTKAVTLTLATVLLADEKNSIGGEEYEHRLAPKQDTCLGYQHREWLIEHQDKHPALKALLGKVYIDFSGLVVMSADGYRFVPYLDRGGGRWELRWRWLGLGFGPHGRIAVSGK